MGPTFFTGVGAHHFLHGTCFIQLSNFFSFFGELFLLKIDISLKEMESTVYEGKDLFFIFYFLLDFYVWSMK